MSDRSDGGDGLQAVGDSRSIGAYLNPLAMLRNLWGRRELIARFTWREIRGRYKGTTLGVAWSFVNPLAQLAIFTFLFGVVFHSRWPEARTDRLSEFALTLFCGLIVFTVFSECASAAPGLVLRNPNYVKKVVFPLEILSLGSLGSAIFHAALSLGVLVAAQAVLARHAPLTLLWVPVVGLPLVFLSLGASWILASLGVFFRDIQQVIGLVLTALLFCTPVFYSASSLPEGLQWLVRVNPLAFCVDSLRQVALWGQAPDWGALGAWCGVCAAVMLGGYAFFMRTKRAFADVI